jgi:asparagine synthase (glutamine-hydrolysing)
MSGIAGTYHLDGRPADRLRVDRMIERMAHRGPDGSGVAVQGAAGFGHLMLHTTPESLHERMPWVSRDGRRIITADARIDNREELAALLGLDLTGAKPVTDSHLILAAYVEWGDACAARLLGDFAFAIWDADAQRLFCARDHSGVKPFYYAMKPGQLFAFASEIKALLQLPEIPEVLNEIRLGEYLTNHSKVDKQVTAFQGILRLPAACTLTVREEGMAVHRYWEPKVRVPDTVLSDEHYAQKFREIFTEAVRCRLRSGHSVGSELSGGLDSSFVTCTARNLLRQTSGQLHTISVAFDGHPECDERPYINSVLDQGGVTAHVVSGDTFGPLTYLEQIYGYLDDGFTGGNHHLIWKCYETANTHGIRVVLDGFDGDTVVSHGLEYFGELARAGEWQKFAAEAQAAHDLMLEAPDKQSIQDVLGSPRDLLGRYGFPVLGEMADARRPWSLLATVWKIRRHFRVRLRGLLNIYGRRLAAAFRKPPRAAPQSADRAAHLRQDFVTAHGLDKHFLRNAPPVARTVRDQQRLLLDSDTFARAMEVRDHYAAAFALEVRHPFMDKRLIEFCLSLPPEQSLSRGWTRLVMRNAMKGVVPDMVQFRRGKTNLATAFDHGLFEIDAARLDAALGDGGPLAQYVRPEHIQELRAKGRAQPGRDIWMLCMYATLSIWLRTREFEAQQPGESGKVLEHA